MEGIGRILIFGGLVMAGLGAFVLLLGRFTTIRLGELPGDILIRKPNVTVSIPITTMLVISGLLSLVLWLASLVRK